ncbi:MAG: hypothetical protein J6X28_03155 [Bacilli bacterium]|nr:hypothetical protein [Bacilli bacterium]
MLEIKEIPEMGGSEELEKVCYTLYGYREKGIDAFYDFNGVKIYSKNITGPDSIEKMYQKVYGCSYAEHVKEKAKKQRPIWLESGYQILPTEKHERWEQFVDSVIEAMDSYAHGPNPITDTLVNIARINSIASEQELREFIWTLDGSNKVLIKAAIEFSNKGDLIRKIVWGDKSGEDITAKDLVEEEQPAEETKQSPIK